MPTISANATDQAARDFRILAAIKGTSVREEAGSAIEAHLARNRACLAAGAKLPPGNRRARK